MKITRTITTYIYSYGEYDANTGMITNCFSELYTKPLGPRLQSKRLAEINANRSNPVLALGHKEDTALYSMDIDHFIELAERIDPSDTESE